jgi:hypothetical protein
MTRHDSQTKQCLCDFSENTVHGLDVECVTASGSRVFSWPQFGRRGFLLLLGVVPFSLRTGMSRGSFTRLSMQPALFSRKATRSELRSR